MKVTIVTMYQVHSAETFVGVVDGVISEEDRQKLSTRFNMGGDDGMPDNLFFCEINVKDDAKKLRQLLNVGTSGDVVNREWAKKHGEEGCIPTCPRCHGDTGSHGQCLAGCKKRKGK